MLSWLLVALVAVLMLARAWHRGSRQYQPETESNNLSAGKSRDGYADQKTTPSAGVEPLPGFDWKQTKPNAFRPFKPIFHVTMGVQASSSSDLIVIDQDYAEKMEYRRKVMQESLETVVGAVPEGLAPAQELYTHLLADYLPARYPDMFSLDEDKQTFHSHVTGHNCSTVPPQDVVQLLRLLGEIVEDDLFLLVQTPTGHRLVAFVCCHPSGFDPSAKLGQVLADIHKPVPGYEKIGPSMERFFARLKVGEVVRRLNWAISTDPQLFTPAAHQVRDKDVVDEEVDIDKARLRVELQSLSRLAQTSAVLFSFKSYLYPLMEVKAEGMGPELADAIDGLGKGNAPGMTTYKGVARWGKSICEYLRS